MEKTIALIFSLNWISAPWYLLFQTEDLDDDNDGLEDSIDPDDDNDGVPDDEDLEEGQSELWSQ